MSSEKAKEKILYHNLPCLVCDSSDARQEYEGGTSYCFSCKTFFPAELSAKYKGVKTPYTEKSRASQIKIKTNVARESKLPTIEEINSYKSAAIKDRCISKEVAEFYGVKISYNEDGQQEAHYYPYGDDHYKLRMLPKDFAWVGGKPNELFGKEKFNGAGRKLIICEGEIDTLSIAEASYDRYKKFYPIVGMSSSSDIKSLIECREWIRSFQEVILCLDNDPAGEEAKSKAIKIIGIDKLKIVKLERNDANDVLRKDGSSKLLNAVFEAAPYIPNGILSKEALWKRIEEYDKIKSQPYPPCLEGLNQKVKGARLGEIALFIAGTGAGKSTVLKEIMLEFLENTKHKIGILSLEEGPEETARKMAGMQLKQNPNFEDIPLDKLKIGFDEVFKDERVMILDHQEFTKDETILDKIEYMCLLDYKYIFIDHITILVSEGVEDMVGNEAQDRVMNALLRMVKKYNVWIGLVSHLRKVGQGAVPFEQGKLPTLDDIRGSGSVKQISFDIFGFARNMSSDEAIERNTIKIIVLKSRYSGLTGPVSGAYYNYETGRLVHDSEAPIEEIVEIV